MHLEMQQINTRKIFDKAKEYKEIVESQDFLIGTHPHEGLTKCLMKIKTQAKYELISGLHRNLKLAVNCVYAISSNVNTHDGLINGAVCTLKYVEYINQQTTIRPHILWVHFSDMTVGTQQRKMYKMFYHEGISFSHQYLLPLDNFLWEMQKVQEHNFQ